MLKSCHYCGRIHDSKHICLQKKEAQKLRQKKKDTPETKFRYTKQWKDKRESIRVRDRQVCQLCVRGLHNPERIFETEDLSVHHIVPVAEDWDRRLDDYNLITLCPRHHEMAEKGEVKREELSRIAEEQEERDGCPACG